MKIIALIISMLCCYSVIGQTDTTLSLDQLQVPSSPAFTMLGISPNSVERPKNPTDFAISIGNASSGFTTIPKDYAVEFSPFWIFSKKQATYKDFISNKVGKNIIQTVSISAATTSAISRLDSSEFRKVAFALKFSIFRGELREEFKQWGDSVSMYLHKLSEGQGQIQTNLQMNDNIIKNLLQTLQVIPLTNVIAHDSVEKLIAERTDEITIIAGKEIDKYTDEIEQLRKLGSRTDFKRYGFKLDFALGTVLDYPDTTFEKCYVSRFSSWVTLGVEYPQFNLLAVGRFSENLNHSYKNDSNILVKNINLGEFDFGFRIYKDFTEKFTMSFEYLRRMQLYNASKLDKNVISYPVNSSRYVFSMNYKVGKNQNLSFTYGKDFDNTYIKKGNLIASLNLLLGFGASRPFGSKN